MNSYSVEVNSVSEKKHGQSAAGDTFLSRKCKGENRVIAVLADGLGSGIKANVLSSLTATAALNTVEHHISPEKSAEMIYRTLPVCSERKISYSTFTIADIRPGISSNIVEFDNPPSLLVRNGKIVDLQHDYLQFSGAGKMRKISVSSFVPMKEDRIIFISDGVTQSGMGTVLFPLGWGQQDYSDFVLSQIKQNNSISARELSEKIVNQSIRNDLWKPKDDITCSVIYIRQSRSTLICSGPPFHQDRDGDLGSVFDNYPGKKVICGGTTATIIARELNRKIEVVLDQTDYGLPPSSKMEGADFVSEGILTLCRVSDYLEHKKVTLQLKDPAAHLTEILKDSDKIKFLVGTRINNAHQDPNMPIELEIRRNIVKKICRFLELNYLKETTIEYI